MEGLFSLPLGSRRESEPEQLEDNKAGNQGEGENENEGKGEKRRPLSEIIKQLEGIDYSELPPERRLLVFKIIQALNSDHIDLNVVRGLANVIIPTQCQSLRAYVWRLLIGYFPLDVQAWATHVETQKALYACYVVNTRADTRANQEDAQAWGNDEQIAADIKRTRHELDFMHTFTKKSVPGQQETHAEAFRRMLTVYARSHKETPYLQGMNELLAVLYITYEEGALQDFVDSVESDTYFSFVMLMDKVKGNYEYSLHPEKIANNALLIKATSVVKRWAPKILARLKKLKLGLHMFCVKWILLLFAQNYNLPEVQVLWEAMLSHQRTFNYVAYLVAGLILSREKALFSGDFGDTMKVLQEATARVPVKTLKTLADKLSERDGPLDPPCLFFLSSSFFVTALRIDRDKKHAFAFTTLAAMLFLQP